MRLEFGKTMSLLDWVEKRREKGQFLDVVGGQLVRV